MSKVVARRGRRRLIRVMRGYRRLKSDNQLGLITDVKEAITNTPVRGLRGASALLFGAGISNAEVIVRQYLLVRVARLDLNRALLAALGEPATSVVYPAACGVAPGATRFHGLEFSIRRRVARVRRFPACVWDHLNCGGAAARCEGCRHAFAAAGVPVRLLPWPVSRQPSASLSRWTQSRHIQLNSAGTCGGRVVCAMSTFFATRPTARERFRRARCRLLTCRRRSPVCHALEH